MREALWEKIRGQGFFARRDEVRLAWTRGFSKFEPSEK
jgi:hypothetical protein